MYREDTLYKAWSLVKEKGHAWYLRGYCQEKHAIRVFKLSRMKRVECLDESFKKKKLMKIIFKVDI
ncbi:MAG TPA: hypothetical protein DCR69_15250 [Clostridium sp.]|nr:hypothetical protein [Clostridium sp.]